MTIDVGIVPKHNGGGLQVIHTLNTHFERAVDYRTYRIGNESSKYDHTVFKNISKIPKHKTAQMQPQTLDPFNPISITGFLYNIKLAYDAIEIHEGAAM